MACKENFVLSVAEVKIYQEKLFNDFRLSERVPEHNFYRRLGSALDLDYLYGLTRDFYGGSGQKSIDPVVFFKLCLVGYLENIASDRKLVEHCGMRLDILYFLDYDIDEELPWHSTISRTRQLFPEDVFEAVFTKVFALCVDAGMVSGHTQAVDSAPVKANASMDSLELKVPEEELEAHLRKVRHISARDRQKPLRQAKTNKAPNDQQHLSASSTELQEIKSRNQKWAKDQACTEPVEVTSAPVPATRAAATPAIRPITALPTPMRASAYLSPTSEERARG